MNDPMEDEKWRKYLKRRKQLVRFDTAPPIPPRIPQLERQSSIDPTVFVPVPIPPPRPSKARVRRAVSLIKAMSIKKEPASGKKKNPWLEHVAKFRTSHPGLSYKEILQKAKATYTKVAPRAKSPKKFKGPIKRGYARGLSPDEYNAMLAEAKPKKRRTAPKAPKAPKGLPKLIKPNRLVMIQKLAGSDPITRKPYMKMSVPQLVAEMVSRGLSI